MNFKIFVATGSNVGNRLENLRNCIDRIRSKNFQVLEQSLVYESPAVDYLQQPDFLNQILCLKDDLGRSPLQILEDFQLIESQMGRVKIIDKGPRNIDIDILIIDNLSFNSDKLILPHPGIFTRSFFAIPLTTLESFKELSRHYKLPLNFDNNCWIYTKS